MRVASSRAGPIVCALALLGLAGCGGAPSDPRGVTRGETLLTVWATGRTEAAPDQALFTAGLSSIAANARAATERNAERMARITEALADSGVEARDIQTQNVSLGRIDYGANRGKYEVSSTLSVRVRDPKRAGEAIAAVTDAGANILSGPNLSIADPEKASLNAYGAAYRAARAKAEAYAVAAGLRIDRVLTIRDGGGGSDMVPMAEAQNQMAAPPPVVRAPPIMVGTNAGVVSVSVDFALAPR